MAGILRMHMQKTPFFTRILTISLCVGLMAEMVPASADFASQALAVPAGTGKSADRASPFADMQVRFAQQAASEHRPIASKAFYWTAMTAMRFWPHAAHRSLDALQRATRGRWVPDFLHLFDYARLNQTIFFMDMPWTAKTVVQGMLEEDWVAHLLFRYLNVEWQATILEALHAVPKPAPTYNTRRALLEVEGLIRRRAELEAQLAASLANHSPSRSMMIASRQIGDLLQGQKTLNAIVYSDGSSSRSWDMSALDYLPYGSSPKEKARVVVELFLAHVLSDVLSYDIVYKGFIPRADFDAAFHLLYPPENQHPLFTSPADLGRLAMSSFSSDEKTLRLRHERFIAYFQERDGRNPYVWGMAADLGRHLRALNLDDGLEVTTRARLSDAVDYVMAFPVLHWLLSRHEQIPAEKRTLIALIDLFAGDPDVLMNEASFKTLSRDHAVRTFGSLDARAFDIGAKIRDAVYVDDLSPALIHQVFTQFNRLRSSIQSHAQPLKRSLAPISGSGRYSPLQQRGLFFRDFVSDVAAQNGASATPIPVTFLDIPSVDLRGQSYAAQLFHQENVLGLWARVMIRLEILPILRKRDVGAYGFKDRMFPRNGHPIQLLDRAV